jgi:hypothetical protein
MVTGNQAVGGFASGEVKQVDGDTIQLSTANEVLLVKLSDGAQIEKTGPGSLSDIQPGQRITVIGSRQQDGSFAAQSVQIGVRAAGIMQRPQGSGGN